MKCEEYQLLIEDYGDAALDPKTAARATSHLATCAHCAAFNEQLGREAEIYARYQRDVEVTPMLWSSIQATIKQERAAASAGIMPRIREALVGWFAAPRLSPALAAALVVIAVGVTATVMTLMNSRSREQIVAQDNRNASGETQPGSDKGLPAVQPPAVNTAPPQVAVNEGSKNQSVKAVSSPAPKRAAAVAQSSPEQLVREAEQKYLTAIAILSRDVNRNRSQLDPIMLARFDASLSEIDRTIKETRRVVRENPGDPIALQYLLAAYSKKVDVLREMTAD